MQLQLKEAINNKYKLRGFFVQGADPSIWLNVIKSMGLSFENTQTYPLPDVKAGKVWGCFILQDVGSPIPERFVAGQEVHENFYIPAYTYTYPDLTNSDFRQLLKGKMHIFHPYLGLVECNEAVDWKQTLSMPVELQVIVSTPAETVFIPTTIRNFSISADTPDETLQNMDTNLFPEQKQAGKPSLNIWEKLQLFFLGLLIAKSGLAGAGTIGLAKWLYSITKFLGLNKLSEKLTSRYQDLEERNQKEMNKLLDLFEKDPDNALKYAIPINEAGRGSGTAAFSLSQRWFDFGLFGSGGSNNGPSVVFSDSHLLSARYEKTAQDYIAKKQFHKAAFIYLKLLNNKSRAAEMLREGKFYAEAAALFMKAEQLSKAAECYLLAKMTFEAIEIYKQLKAYETLGDIYASLHETKEAMRYYELVVEGFIAERQYIKASDFINEKLNDTDRARQTLLTSWFENREAVEALTQYFLMADELLRPAELEDFYHNAINNKNAESFLHVIKKIFPESEHLPQNMRSIFYEIISKHGPSNHLLLKEVKYLNPTDNKIIKDVVAYKYYVSQTRRSS